MKNLYAQDAGLEFGFLFRSPGPLYRDTVFWSWNCALESEELRRQIAIFRRMGMGGFHMHARTGLATPYLGPEFMARVRDCVREARNSGMLAWLYDEDRWPSGAAGGLVTQNPEFRARHLLFTPFRRSDPPDSANDDSGRFLAAWAVRLDEAGDLLEYHRIEEDAPPMPGMEKFYAYRMVAEPDPWFNGRTYVDTLNPRAIQRFVELTHEAYLREVGGEFGHTIPAIFTDEPQFSWKGAPNSAREHNPGRYPYTDDLPESYRRAWGCELFDTFPEVVWELAGGGCSVARYRYHDHVAERFAAAFADTLGAWCARHNLRLTGHVVGEGTLGTQTMLLGEAMRSYRAFQLPGIDMLRDRFEFATAKQAQSVSRQNGCGGVLSEVDGETGWDWDFKGHKGHGDWQAALGVTVRVPHLAWASMAGEAKRDYPASISYQSCWWRNYPLIADHFARVNVAMSRGRPCVRVAVIHPIESYWLVAGPLDRTADRRAAQEENFDSLLHWLLHGLIDFDFLAESLLPGQNAGPRGSRFAVGMMEYDVVVVPPVLTLRKSTLERLEAFRDCGGRLIFAGEVAACCDAERSDRVLRLAERSERIAFSRSALLDALAPCRELEVRNARDFSAVPHLLYQMREEGGTRYCFLVNTERIGEAQDLLLSFRGSWQLFELDTATGGESPLAARQESGWTRLRAPLYPHGHLLLKLVPAEESRGGTAGIPLLSDEENEAALVKELSGPVPVRLSEPNVLLLDRPRWRFSGETAWRLEEEILRLDNLLRRRFHLNERHGRGAQPWAERLSRKPLGTVELSYRVESRVDLYDTLLALESPESVELRFDERPVSFQDQGCWIDPALRCTALPPIPAGTHELTLRIGFSEAVGLERCFLLGDFGVECRGGEVRIIEPVRELPWCDITEHGLPFYGGVLTFCCSFRLEQREELLLRIPSRVTRTPEWSRSADFAYEVADCGYRGVMLSASLDGRHCGDLAFAPYQCSLGVVEPGEHRLELSLCGSRNNCMGPVHLAFRVPWMTPAAWRTVGDRFSTEYRLAPFGITIAPRLLRRR